MRLPIIQKTEVLAQSRFFKIEAMHLTFSNGEERVYERLPAVGEQGVIVVAVNDNEELLLIREYAAGFHEFQLTLPKGAGRKVRPWKQPQLGSWQRRWALGHPMCSL